MPKKKVKEIKLTYRYVGDESPEMKAESPRRLDAVFDMLFDEAYKELLEEEKLLQK